MRVSEIPAVELFNNGRWRVEIFTDDNADQIVSRWPMESICDIAVESTTAVQPSEHEAAEFYYIGLENVEPITGDAVSLHKRNRDEIKSRSKVFCKDCVLYGRLRPNLRKVFWVESNYGQGLCSTEFIVMKPNKQRILPEVLRALLASEAISKQLARLQIGAALPRVSAEDFFKARLPVPPMKVQEKMAAKLAELRKERLHLKHRLAENPKEIDSLVVEFALEKPPR